MQGVSQPAHTRRDAIRSVALVALTVSSSLAASAPSRAHSAWPDLYSAKLWVGCSDAGANDPQRVCRLDLVATLEVPVAEMILSFREAHADLDLAAAVRSGEIERLEEAFRRRQFERMGTSLTLRRAGAEVAGAWHPTAKLGNGYGIEGFFSYELRFEAAEPEALLAVDRMALSISNRNFERSTVMYANVIDPAAPLAVIETSTAQPQPGADLTPGSEDEIALWSADEQRRVFHLVVEPAKGRGEESP